MIAKGTHRQTWNRRRLRTKLKKDRKQSWADDFKTIIFDYVDHAKFKEEPQLAYDLAYALRGELIRADKETGQQPETASDHADRIVAQVANWHKFLKVPLDVTADIPQFTAVRFAFDKPLSQLDDLQFMAKTPKHMKWPRKKSVDNTPPYLGWKAPTLPKHDDLGTLVSKIEMMDDKKLVNMRVVQVYDDHTAKAQEQESSR